MKRAQFSSFALSLLGVMASVATTGCHGEEHHAEEHGEFQITSPLRTNTEIAREYVAQVHAIQHIELRAMERGYLQGIFVDEGQAVKKGQRMFQIMPTLYQAELQKAQAEAEFAGIEFKNTKMLADSKVVSPNELALAKAKLDKAKAEMALSKVHRSLTEIRAPFDGIMGRLHVRQGSLMGEGELLTTLSDNTTMWVYFNVAEAEYLDYKMREEESESREVKLVMANGKEFSEVGKIETIQADFNHETGTIAFRAAFPNPKGLLRHGETGKVVMVTPLENALVIPQKATYDVLDKKYVFVVDDQNVVHSRLITVAEELPHLYVVADGLAATDKILLEGLRKVKDGDSIAPSFQQPAEVMAHLDVPAE